MQTALPLDDYLQSLGVGALTSGGQADEVYALDGACLYRLNDEHFVVVCCEAHPHQGARLLRKVIPADWVVFAQVKNQDDLYVAHHWGPSWNS